jgi:hydrogenase expression/formation protein HypC
MCLGIPAQIVSVGDDHPDLATVDMIGVRRTVNVALLDGPAAPGDWVLVHMGFVLERMTAQEAADALLVFTDEREAVEREAVEREAVEREAVEGE